MNENDRSATGINATEATPLALSDLLAQVGAVIKSNVPISWVVAEIAAFQQNRASGHCYLDLIERSEDGQEVAKARASIWAAKSRSLLGRFQEETGSPLCAGLKVLLRVQSSFHPQYGFAFVIQDVDPSYTLGDTERKLARIRSALHEAGIFEKNLNRPHPLDFTRVAVIAPADAAGLGDFKSQADRLASSGLCEFEYFHARFQGKSVAEEVVKTLRDVLVRNKSQGTKYFDAIAIIRGGGAVTDLAYLNELAIANAVCLTPIPVFTGIGHERDTTILDEVANYTAHTPSKLIGYITSVIVQNAQRALQDWEQIQSSARLGVSVATKDIDRTLEQIRTVSKSNLTLVDASVDREIEIIQRQSKSLLEQSAQAVQANFAHIKQTSSALTLLASEKINTQFHAIEDACRNTLTTCSEQSSAHLDSVRESAKSIVTREDGAIETTYADVKRLIKDSVETARIEVEATFANVIGLGPQHTLQRGFAIVRHEGRAITRKVQAEQVLDLDIEFADGSLSVQRIGK